MPNVTNLKQYWAYHIEACDKLNDNWFRSLKYPELYVSSVADSLVKEGENRPHTSLKYRKVADTPVFAFDPKSLVDDKQYVVEVEYEHEAGDIYNSKREAEEAMNKANKKDRMKRRVVEYKEG